MSASQSRTVLVALLVGGLALGFAGVGFASNIMAAGFAFAGIGQLFSAVLLARHVVTPGWLWGRSPLGQVLHGTAWLLLAILFLTQDRGGTAIAWPVALIPLVLLVIGFRVEHKARVRQLAV